MSDKFSQFHVDPYELVEELEHQAMRHREYCERATDANYDYEMAKHHCDEVEADLDHKIRANPGNYGLVKATDKSVEMAIRCQPEWRKAAREVIEAKREFSQAKNDVDASEQKRKMIEVGAQLILSAWYAERPLKSKGAMDRRAADERTERLHGPAKKFRPRPE